MTVNKKIIAVAGAVILLTVPVGYFVARTMIGKHLNKAETRSEIEGMIAQGVGGFLKRPRASVGPLALRGLSLINVSGLKVYDGKDLIYAAKNVEIQCSLIAQLISGSCDLRLNSDLGEDGKFSLEMILPRAALVADSGYRYNLRGSGTLSDFNLHKIFNRSGKSDGAAIRLTSARLDGAYELVVSGQTNPELVVNFTGELAKMKAELNIRGKRTQAIPRTPVRLRLDGSRMELLDPLKVSFFGLALNYKGAVEFRSEPEWRGEMSVAGSSMLAGFVPRLLRCKSTPGSHKTFQMSGPFSGPVCR